MSRPLRPMARTGRAGLPALCLALGLLAPLVHPGAPLAAPRYTFDVDPVRLGTKALEEGRLADAKARFTEAMTNDYQTDRAQFGLAEVARREGRAADAEGLYRAALAARAATGKPAYPEAHAALGLLLAGLDRPADAAAEFDRALAEKPGLWEAQYGQALLLLAQQKWAEAKPLVDKGADRHGLKEGEDRYQYALALWLAGTDDLAAAETAALTAFSIDSTNPDYGTLVARIYDRRNTPALAVDAYERALAAPGMTPTAPLMSDLGRLYQKVGRLNEARDAYGKAIGLDSTYTPPLKNLGLLYVQARQYDKAARVLNSYVAAAPTDVEGLVGLSNAAREARLAVPALDAARRAMALDSTRVDVRAAYARAGLGSRDKAVRATAARLFLGLDPAGRTAADLVQVAAWQTETKQFGAADSSLVAAARLDPALPDIPFQRGLLALAQGQPDSAVTRFQAAIALAPTNALYHLNLGVAHLTARRNDAALPELRRAVALNGEMATARILLGQALVQVDSLTAAEAEYRRALELEPGSARALRGLGYCTIRRSAYAEAAKFYKAAADADPGNADGWAGLGSAQLGLKNWNGAEASFKKAQAIDPNNVTLKNGLELLNSVRKGGGG